MAFAEQTVVEEMITQNKNLSGLKPFYAVNLIVDKKAHWYQIGEDQTWHPGVTTALGMINKPALIPWAAKMASENIKDYLLQNSLERTLTKLEIEKACFEGKNLYKKKAADAADIGTRAHNAVNQIILGQVPILTDDIKPAVDAFLSWKGSKTLKIELGDTKLGSKVFGYGGSLDCLAFDGLKVVLIDFKTSTSIWPEMGYQVAAYAQAFKETFGIEVSDALILRLGKTKSEFEVKRLSNLSHAFEAFLSALKLYKLSKYQMFEEVS